MFPEQYVQYCYDARYNPDFSLSNQWCTMFARDSATGEIGGHSRTSIAECVQLGAPSGLDLQVDWRFDLGPGQVGVNWFVSWLDGSGRRVWCDGSASTEYCRNDRPGMIPVCSQPEWKSNLHLSYAWRDLTLGAGWRYIDAMTDAFEPEFQVPSVDYFEPGCELRILVGAARRAELAPSVSRT